jgi:hypothetical protein|tara:strand:+ start:649 stop:1086 length:438 start_codon:yes stop_codon:yes gene_type:complete
MKKILAIIVSFSILGCSNSSPYEGLWIIDNELTTQSCQSTMMADVTDDLDENPFGAALAMGMGSAMCGMISNMIPVLDIEDNKVEIEAFGEKTMCSIDPSAGTFTCDNNNSEPLPISIENGFLVWETPSEEDGRSMKLYFKRKDQ